MIISLVKCSNGWRVRELNSKSKICNCLGVLSLLLLNDEVMFHVLSEFSVNKSSYLASTEEYMHVLFSCGLSFNTSHRNAAASMSNFF